MFTGSVYFKYTPNGYVVYDAIEFNRQNTYFKRGKDIQVFFTEPKILRVEGTFNFTPVKGQFCRRPHKLLVWSKS